jgi:hypothetical protein
MSRTVEEWRSVKHLAKLWRYIRHLFGIRFWRKAEVEAAKKAGVEMAERFKRRERAGKGKT